MGSSGFTIAMDALIGEGRYETPSILSHQVREWIIASSWGPDAEFLAISRTGIPANGAPRAPEGLQPITTFAGLLLSRALERREGTFLLVRHMPLEVTVAGIFFPTDGYARMSFREDGIHLESGGRYAHTRGYRSGRESRGDVPEPAPLTDSAVAWRMEAIQRSWAGEFTVP